MNVVDAGNKSEIAMIHAVLFKKFGQLYADIEVVIAIAYKSYGTLMSFV